MAREDKYSVRGCKSARDFQRAVAHQGGEITHGGRHDIAHDPDGKGSVAIPQHGGDDLATGTRHSIMKALLAIGFFILIPACICIAASVARQDRAAAAWAAYQMATATPVPVQYAPEAAGCLPMAILALALLALV
jgi:predicted RNA binding protein YcfA (HicA-like mRNA interferase family)